MSFPLQSSSNQENPLVMLASQLRQQRLNEQKAIVFDPPTIDLRVYTSIANASEFTRTPLQTPQNIREISDRKWKRDVKKLQRKMIQQKGPLWKKIKKMKKGAGRSFAMFLYKIGILNEKVSFEEAEEELNKIYIG